MRSKKALYNSISYLVLEIISVISGFILPRFILSAFGSTYNGAITSITQFLSIVTLLRAGVGGVTRAALYKPLAENNTDAISAIMNATKIFMKKIAFIFCGGLCVFAVIFPFILKDFEWIFTFSLVLIMGISTFLQYYFAISYQMLLVADQRQYVSALLQCVSMILNLLTSIVLILLGFGIHVVKLGSALVYCINPIFTVLYCQRKYHINKKITPDFSALSQRWDAFMHQLAGYVQENTDVTVLTICSNVREVSVYSVYYLICNGIKKLISTLTTGLEAAFGNMIALNDYNALNLNVKRTEFILYSIASILYSCLLVLIIPFISVYTAGITDANYIRPAFAVVITAAEFIFCIRTPYQNIVEAAGHFKQTKKGAIAEAIINLGISITLVINYGLIGVAIGTLVSMVIRTFELAHYASKYILKRRFSYVIRRFIISICEITIIYLIAEALPTIAITDYLSWFSYAVLIAVIAVLVTLLFSFIFDRALLVDCLIKIKSIITLRTPKPKDK